MKKIINAPENYVDEMLQGIYAAHGDQVKYVNDDLRCYCTANKKDGKVAIITGGGTGHLPLFLGYVGDGLLDGCGVVSGRDTDKFDGDIFDWEYMDGLPVVKENSCAHITAEVVSMTEMETHFVILARVKDAVVTSNYTPMTYKYYHEVIKGKAPKNAPTYQAPEAKQDKETWVCGVCGYIYEGDLTQEPDDFVCPVCKQPKSMFEKQ